MLPSAPGAAVITNWLGNTTAAASTAGPFSTQLMALICWAMDCRMDAAVVCVNVSAADPSELETATGPDTPAFSVMKISLPYVPPVVAVQFGSDALIWPAILFATPALFSESSRQEYVAEPIRTQWLYAALPCHH